MIKFSRFVSVALIALTAFSPLADAAGKSRTNLASGLGMADKQSHTYYDLLDIASEALERNQSGIQDFNGVGRNSREVAEEFAVYCADGDSIDKVSWSAESGAELKVTFSCVRDGEEPKLRERLYVLNLTGAIERNRKIWVLADLKLLASDIAPQPALEITSEISRNSLIPNEKSKLVKATIAITGSILLSGAAARDRFNGDRDQVRNAGVSGGVAAVGAALSHFVLELSPEASALAGGALSLFLGAAKETGDPYLGGNRSGADMKANGLGAGVGSVTFLLAFKFF